MFIIVMFLLESVLKSNYIFLDYGLKQSFPFFYLWLDILRYKKPLLNG
jgi:hypothetical protein